MFLQENFMRFEKNVTFSKSKSIVHYDTILMVYYIIPVGGEMKMLGETCTYTDSKWTTMHCLSEVPSD